MKEIIKQPWQYSFYQDEQELILSVVCGSIGIFEITIKLNEVEKTEYELRGLEYIEELAKKIQYTPSLYSDRNIHSPQNLL